MDELHTLIMSALAALTITIAAIYSLGCDGSVAGYRIGPSSCLLKVAGR